MQKTILSVISLVITALLVHTAFKSLDKYALKLMATSDSEVRYGNPEDLRKLPVQLAVSSETIVPEKYPPFEMENVDFNPSQRELAKFNSEIFSLLKSRNFKALEKKAAEYRISKARFIGGRWKLRSLYTLLCSELGDKDDDWEKNIALVQQWRDAFPDSITARTALAKIYLSYAWKARGDNFTAKVPASAWPIFNGRIDKAEIELNAAKMLSDHCPEYYVVLMEFGKSKGWDEAVLKSIFNEAVQIEPEYDKAYTAMAVSLMPRWSGTQGEWERFADHIKMSVGGDRGLELYYQIVAEIGDRQGQGFFRENHPSWTDTKEGFKLMAKEYGVTRYHMSQFAQLSLAATDAQTSCKVFKLLQGRDGFDAEFWQEKKNFDSASLTAAHYCSTPRFGNQAP